MNFWMNFFFRALQYPNQREKHTEYTAFIIMLATERRMNFNNENKEQQKQ